MNSQSLRAEAESLAAGGDLSGAIGVYKKLLQADKKDTAACARIAELFERAGQREHAIRFYETAAKRYADGGAFPRAVALAKAILRIDGRRRAIHDYLASIYADQKAPELEPLTPDEEDVGDDIYFQHSPTLDDDPTGEGATEEVVELEPIGDDEVVLLEELEEEEVVVGTVAGPTDAEVLAQLPKVPIFSDLNPKEFGPFLHSMELKLYEAGERVVTEGETGDSFYIITAGEADIVKEKDKPEPVRLTTLSDGAFFGEFAYLTGAPRTASVIAKTQLELLELKKSSLDKLVKRFPHTGTVLQKFFRERALHTVLSLSPLLKPLSKAEKKSVLTKFTYGEAKRGESILVEGDQGKAFYVIAYGRVDVSQKNKWGGEEQLASLGSGEFFGEISLLYDRPATATVTAAERSAFFLLAKDDFTALAKQSDAFRTIVKQYADERSRYNEELQLNLADLGEEGII